MKNLIYSILFLLIVAATSTFTSCTHNNGDIGDWFGLWKVTSITIDGAQDTTYHGNLFFAFQNNIFCQRLILENHDYNQTFGTWSQDGTNLTVTFSDSIYMPLTESHMQFGTNVMRIAESSGSDITLAYSVPFHNYVYTLKKW